MPNYELTYILRPSEEDTLTANGERIAKLVQNAGGEILATNAWGRRRLAFPIRKINDGFYTTLYITLPGNAVRGLERSLRLMDDVLRYLVVHVETHTLPSTPPPAVEAPAAPVAQAAAAAPVAQAESAAAPVAQVESAAAPVAQAEGATAPAAEAAAEPVVPAAEAPQENVPAVTTEGS